MKSEQEIKEVIEGLCHVMGKRRYDFTVGDLQILVKHLEEHPEFMKGNLLEKRYIHGLIDGLCWVLLHEQRSTPSKGKSD